MWDQIEGHLSDDLSGWTALDVACNSGFYSIELALGASVVALEPNYHFLEQARWCARQFGCSGIDFWHADVYEMAHVDRSFDLVLFMGGFYHLRYPLLALDILAEKTRRLMVLQTLTVPGDEVMEPPDDMDFEERSSMNADGWPKMAFIEHSLAGDFTNWWAPNHPGVEAMLRSCGMRILNRPGHEIYLCVPSDEGLRHLRDYADFIDLMITRHGDQFAYLEF